MVHACLFFWDCVDSSYRSTLQSTIYGSRLQSITGMTIRPSAFQMSVSMSATQYKQGISWTMTRARSPQEVWETSSDQRQKSAPDSCYTILPPFLPWKTWILLPLELSDQRLTYRYAKGQVSSKIKGRGKKCSAAMARGELNSLHKKTSELQSNRKKVSVIMFHNNWKQLNSIVWPRQVCWKAVCKWTQLTDGLLDLINLTRSSYLIKPHQCIIFKWTLILRICKNTFRSRT